ncbi:MAG: albusnodin family lasso peptide [Pseudonocardiales bacterium]|nr:albusnodin family lasso peptide [Pseudonocardiales bacterium]
MDEFVVDLGDAADVTRGQGGAGRDDKRYTYN